MKHRVNRLLPFIGALAIAFATATPRDVDADDVRGTSPRVRSEHATIARLIVQATERSATVRREIQIIRLTDGLVYVHEGHCGSGVLACLAMTVETAGPFRLLHVQLDLRRSELETMAAIGHELQHAIEALSDRHVTDGPTIFSFFQQLGPTGSNRFETRAAVLAGDEVLAELRTRAIPR